MEDSRARALGMRRGGNLALKAKAVEEVDEESGDANAEWCPEDIKYDLHDNLALAARNFWRDPVKYTSRGNQRSDSSAPKIVAQG